MKRLFLGLPLLLTMTFVASCSKDIKVTSDVGEVSIVKESAVTTYPFDLSNADTVMSEWLERTTKYLKECSPGLSVKTCSDIYGSSIRDASINIEMIKQMPTIIMVKYRTIDTDVNGDKTASGYKYVSCIPDGKTEERVKWAKLINDVDGVNAKPKKEIGNNLLNDGLVASSVRREVCEKYGHI